ncbi:high affinity copper uptake protein 1 [Musca vetustissima]|uniref:high affinity copper uptake protein 1 n=1 Tax=Musca vetustissima TaxID=27455 RepID=UPI002AB733C4|nr:high affinity copper uptake protein 1 [Musca vetustissima]
MDHDHDHGSGGSGMDGEHDGHGSCPMNMAFHTGYTECILWKGWMTTTVTQFVLSALALFVVAFLYESLKFVREYFLRRAVRNEAERVALELQLKTTGPSTTTPTCHASSTLAPIREKTYAQRIFSTPHLIQTFFNLIQIILSYLMMLVFMTYNYWLCLAVILGLGVGYFFFGWIKQDVYESECCH